MKHLAYLPIDIDVEWPNEELLLQWFENHKLLDNDYWELTSNRHAWAMTSTCKEPKDWRRFDKEMWDNRRTDGVNEGLFFILDLRKHFLVLLTVSNNCHLSN